MHHDVGIKIIVTGNMEERRSGNKQSSPEERGNPFGRLLQLTRLAVDPNIHYGAGFKKHPEAYQIRGFCSEASESEGRANGRPSRSSTDHHLIISANGRGRKSTPASSTPNPPAAACANDDTGSSQPADPVPLLQSLWGIHGIHSPRLIETKHVNAYNWI
ncbi:hypothetical protein RhiXN_11428 [Rhizoctonia solani]|uniref:Uncharacterized protein n=1 Tax=Rhizoctonia solani TaxID=456999 RepID=A0A8H8P616_9AGAM|nr:uncharacterized protein RhiXN_11428 [Rhizoctonia solani]QRW24516.1 hypothetical protein RhiXN_11428 [Rhizoctonia solani]